MKILAIETSCDETAAAVISDVDNISSSLLSPTNDASSTPIPTTSNIDSYQPQLLSNVVVSQIDIFAAYGGVIPEVAARSHLEAILPVIHKALEDANCTQNDIDYIAVTYAPGLLGSLLIGTLTARTLAILWHKPLYAVHHLKAHIYSNWLNSNQRVSTTLNLPSSQKGEGDCLELQNAHLLFSRSSGGPAEVKRVSPAAAGADDAGREKTVKAHFDNLPLPPFPLLSLVISGGHTQIIYMPTHNHFEIIGTTRDDAVGECFDKVAKILGLPYPGGPSVTKCALGQPTSTNNNSNLPIGNPAKYRLPHPKIDGLDFSFSGLKTAVLRAVQADCGLPITTPSYGLASHLTPQQRADFAASFQSTACDILLEKLQLAIQSHPDVKSIVFAGGVSANQILRAKALGSTPSTVHLSSYGLPIYFPEPKFSGDNAAMVGAAAFYEILSSVPPTDPYALNILPRTPIH